MKDEECVYYLDSSKCDSDDCHGCVSRLEENKRKYHDKEIRAKVIEEFAEKICDVCCEESMTVILENRVKADVLTLDGLTEIVWEIAKELKGE